jgi:hypothetical protein
MYSFEHLVWGLGFEVKGAGREARGEKGVG